jgi:DNA-binding IclR family transcriptional regulator
MAANWPGVVNGAQSIHKALRVLRYAAAGGSKGVKLRQVSESCSLTKATAYRILSSLTAEGFLDFDSSIRAYTLGREAYILCWSGGVELTLGF